MSVVFSTEITLFFVFKFSLSHRDNMPKFIKNILYWFSKDEFTCSGGYAAIWKIAYPLILMNASLTIMQVADRIFLSRHSTLEMSAAPVGGALYFWLFSFLTVTSNFTGAIISQLHGAGRKRDCVKAAWSAFYFALAAGAVMSVIVPLTGCALIDHFFDHSAELSKLEKIYFISLAPCGLFQCISAPFYAFFSGRGKTKVVAAINVGGCFINLLLNYILIFGALGAPELGITGAGIATSISMGINFLMILTVFLSVNQKIYRTRNFRQFSRDIPLKLLRFGTLAGIQVFCTFGSFNVMLIAIGRIGETALAASNIALAINSIVFMPLMGFSESTAIIVGNFIGARRTNPAKRAAYRVLRMALLYMFCCVALYLSIPETLARLFAPAQGNGMSFNDVQSLAVNLLMLMSLFGISDSTIQVFCGALRGSGDTLAMMTICSVCAILKAAVALYLTKCGVSVMAIWWIEIITCAVEATLITIRFRSGAWRKIKLIQAGQ